MVEVDLLTFIGINIPLYLGMLGLYYNQGKIRAAHKLLLNNIEVELDFKNKKKKN